MVLRGKREREREGDCEEERKRRKPRKSRKGSREGSGGRRSFICFLLSKLETRGAPQGEHGALSS